MHMFMRKRPPMAAIAMTNIHMNGEYLGGNHELRQERDGKVAAYDWVMLVPVSSKPWL